MAKRKDPEMKKTEKMARSHQHTEYTGPARRRISFSGSSLVLASVGLLFFLYTGSAAFLAALLPLALFSAVAAATGVLMLLELAVKRGATLPEAKAESDPPRPARREAIPRQTAA